MASHAAPEVVLSPDYSKTALIEKDRDNKEIPPSYEKENAEPLATDAPKDLDTQKDFKTRRSSLVAMEMDLRDPCYWVLYAGTWDRDRLRSRQQPGW